MDQYRNIESQQEAVAYIQALQNQHVSTVDDLVARHMLWSPELLYPIIEAMGVIRTIIRLNDGRQCEVTTFSQTGETTATHWVQT